MPDDRSFLPPPATQLARRLRWLIGVRLAVISTVAITDFLLALASPQRPLSFDPLLTVAAATWLVSLGYLALLRLLARHELWQAAIQFAGDLLLISTLVYFTGAIGSPFSLLYLVTIAVAAILLPRRGAIWVATAAYAGYACVLFAVYFGLLATPVVVVPTDERIWRLTYDLAVHLFGFYAVAVLTSYLAQSIRRAERELERQRDSFADLQLAHRDVVQSVTSGLITTDPSGRITSVNRAAEEILGAGERDLLGHHVAECRLFSAAEWERLAGAGDSRARWRAEAELVRGERQLPVGYTVSLLTDAQGTRSGFVLVFQDLSEWRRLQEQLRLKDRMAAVGELAAGIAHEIGNPLAAISGSVQLLSAASSVGAGQRKLLDIIIKESQRLDRTIKGFLRYARPRDRASVEFDVARLVAENFELLRNSEEASGSHSFRLDLVPPAARMTGDPDQISQIFWNLARNALRAMPQGGELAVIGRLIGDTYRLAVRDSGEGMAEERRARLFQPFQSFFDGGTGIGMAIVYRIVQEHGGQISVDSAPGQGTTITVDLPLHPAAAARPEEVLA